MASAVEQTHCDRCREAIRPRAAYCENCGQRTRRARRIVGIAIRVEILFMLVVLALVLGFAGIFYIQKP